ncbi:hypothetical protein HPB50_011414 [Hyalomma asiaticum]|uniref:Uncharacterized protein n=1 Tax=Hyalomma asiaticum TaxID=266040 RepID=A0ACB7T9E5_HYAAI|nr:hypothetical protein HPB50_011414 [Hyalomma asiaticum]
MPKKHCSIALCSSKETDVVYHKFPVGLPQRQQWIDFVRASGRGDTWAPRKKSRICSRHFAPSCYVQDPERLAQLGFSTKALLLGPGALPTVYIGADLAAGSTSAAPSAKRPRHEVRRLKVDATSQCAIFMTSKGTMATLAKSTNTVGLQAVRITEDVGRVKVDASTQCAVRMTLKATQAAFNPRGSRTVGVQTMNSMANGLVDLCAVSWNHDLRTLSRC